jgi:Tfx family DNA-binding protein
VVRYRTQGLTQAEVAKKLKTTVETVGEIENRARLKIEAAKSTMAALQELGATREVLIPNGTSIFEAVSVILLRADVLGVRLQSSADALLVAIRSSWKGKIKGHHLTSLARVEIGADGSLVFK